MKKFKGYGALILGAIFLYDFAMTFVSNTVGQYDVIGFHVSKFTYLAYLLAVAVSFLSYALTNLYRHESAENPDIASGGE